MLSRYEPCKINGQKPLFSKPRVDLKANGGANPYGAHQNEVYDCKGGGGERITRGPDVFPAEVSAPRVRSLLEISIVCDVHVWVGAGVCKQGQTS